jgi:hypothetical protein
VAELRRDLDAEWRRLDEVRARAATAGRPEASSALARIDRERMVLDADGMIAAAASDRDAADRAQRRILDLRVAIDGVEDALA